MTHGYGRFLMGGLARILKQNGAVVTEFIMHQWKRKGLAVGVVPLPCLEH